ncbi:hypothetical protein HYR99_16215 [Candidatus Poribacteria bacterium]|nr:hypothetical protein [Candidatus Poribacteria bacterium]
MRNLAYPHYSSVNPSLGQARSPQPTTTKTIPFDYVFQFTLEGKPKNKVQDVVAISMEGVFVALSVGYSLVLDEQKAPRAFRPVINPLIDSHNQKRNLSSITLGEVTAGLEKVGADLTHGFRLNPTFANALDLPLDDITLDRAFETGCVAAEEVSFLYSLDAVGTGRELQSKPIHNIAGLGIANGDRPFRPFAKPIMFEPRSSIRIQIEEISGPPGTLYIVLQGYKLLGTGRIPE